MVNIEPISQEKLWEVFKFVVEHPLLPHAYNNGKCIPTRELTVALLLDAGGKSPTLNAKQIGRAYILSDKKIYGLNSTSPSEFIANPSEAVLKNGFVFHTSVIVNLAKEKDTEFKVIDPAYNPFKPMTLDEWQAELTFRAPKDYITHLYVGDSSANPAKPYFSNFSLGNSNYINRLQELVTKRQDAEAFTAAFIADAITNPKDKSQEGVRQLVIDILSKKLSGSEKDWFITSPEEIRNERERLLAYINKDVKYNPEVIGENYPTTCQRAVREYLTQALAEEAKHPKFKNWVEEFLAAKQRPNTPER